MSDNNLIIFGASFILAIVICTALTLTLGNALAGCV